MVSYPTWKTGRLLVALLIGLSLSGCAVRTAGESQRHQHEITGALLLWHNWPEPASAAIDDLLHRFRAIHPGATIVGEYVPDAEFYDRFVDQAELGLGPDVIVGVEGVMPSLIGAGLLLDLTGFDMQTSQLSPEAVNALRVNGALYGVPFSGYTNVLYYNRSLIATPATTLADLIAEAEAGHTIAIPVDFYHGYWGVRAFGGVILTPEGDVLADAGFAAWLDWLLQAQQEPNVILSNNYEDLRELFADGSAAYFVGATHELPGLRERLGAAAVGVATLPGASNPQPGAFLELEVMAISRVSAEAELGVELIEFFTNATHQRILALSDFGELPLNLEVQFDKRLFPVEATLNEQETYAVIVNLANEETKERLSTVGDFIYLEVLEGVLTPEEAATLLREEMLAHAK